MKQRVAVRERFERRANPQTAWPDVHPLPYFVPTPTRKPPRHIERIVGDEGVKIAVLSEQRVIL